uniref:Uncharacterized protein n=1 Tax=Timema bartmani TaxID=61472 RepID=A0A7R9EX80_9NEOP|nr:unnamed protein product [Timema bartmani]
MARSSIVSWDQHGGQLPGVQREAYTRGRSRHVLHLRDRLLLYARENKRKWRPEDGGWDAHVVSTVSEWMLSIIFCTFILTYVRDFSYIHLEPPVVRLEIPP